MKTHSENGHFNFKHIGKIIQEVSDDLYEPKFTKKPYTTVIMQTFLNETNDYGKVLKVTISIEEEVYNQLEEEQKLEKLLDSCLK